VKRQIIKTNQVESLKFEVKEGRVERVDGVEAKAGMHLVWHELNGNKKARKETGQRKEQRQPQRYILRIVRKEQSVLKHDLRR
jgi:hypothetical protein